MKKGFTLAEVLITLAIIGIVAAITIPSLMADVNQKAFDNQRKTLHARLANALTAMDRLSGYGVYDNSDPEDIKDTAAESFLVDGLSKVYKIRNICDKDHFEKCGVNESFSTINGDTKDMPKNMSDLVGLHSAPSTDVVTFETNNGESIALFYNPRCQNKSTISSRGSTNLAPLKICANFVYDLNGPKAPNMMGKDMGIITAFYKEEPIVVAPMFDEKTFSSALEMPSVKSTEAADKCEALGSDYRVPTMEEIAALSFNYPVGTIAQGTSTDLWASDIVSAGGTDGYAVGLHIETGYALALAVPRSETRAVLCVKR